MGESMCVCVFEMCVTLRVCVYVFDFFSCVLL